MQPRHLSILGVGLLGASIAMAIRRSVSGCSITGYAHRSSTLEAALDAGLIDSGYADPARAVQGADLVVLCTPVSTLAPLLRDISPAVSANTVVTDVGSTKRSVVAAAEEHLPAGVQFVGSHPMAGSERRGLGAARADLFDGHTCIITPTSRTAPEAVASVEAFWKFLGMRTIRLSPDEHDRRLADISHLPHAVAAALVAMQDEASLPLAGRGFLDATRIAAGDGGLWRDIFVDNQDNLLDSLHRFREQLDQIIERLEPERADDLKKWLDTAAETRNRIRGGG